MITKVKNFFGEVKVELQKASWPWDPKEKGFRRYKELTDSTLVVIIAMLLLGGYVALFDFVLVNFVTFSPEFTDYGPNARRQNGRDPAAGGGRPLPRRAQRSRPTNLIYGTNARRQRSMVRRARAFRTGKQGAREYPQAHQD